MDAESCLIKYQGLLEHIQYFLFTIVIFNTYIEKSTLIFKKIYIGLGRGGFIFLLDFCDLGDRLCPPPPTPEGQNLPFLF